MVQISAGLAARGYEVVAIIGSSDGGTAAALRKADLQDAVVFPGTIRENIAFGRDDAEDDEIAEAVARAELADFVATLPAGLEHFVGDEGDLVSGGERQCIAIARALLGDPALLVLDEPTAQLDAATIERLLDTLDRLRCTIITVTHDPEVAGRADRIIQVREGTVHDGRPSLQTRPRHVRLLGR
jgi:ABC-type multidrug transport system fused ATPase/permease subunit